MSKILLVTHLFHVFSRNVKIILLIFSIPSLKKDSLQDCIKISLLSGRTASGRGSGRAFARQNLVEESRILGSAFESRFLLALDAVLTSSPSQVQNCQEFWKFCELLTMK